MTDYAARRTIMVDTQVRPSDVTKFPIIEAMLAVPRERFVPTAARETAYMGEHVALGQGRVVLDPRTFSKMLDALDIQPDELVLDLGCGLGYSAAILSRLAEAVVAVVEGPLTEGAPKHGPYDVIILQGAVQELPAAILAQIKDGGRIGCLFIEGALGVCRIGYKIDGRLTWRYAFNGAAPILPGFERLPAFQL